MKPFLNDDFLLESDLAQRLYHTVAQRQPIVDYHCHLPPDPIADNRRFRSLTEMWLDGDHYKWRALRACGVPERLITGDASDWEKFSAWAEVVPQTLRNPLYHWTHLELKFPFGISGLLNPNTARDVFDRVNAQLELPAFTTQGLLRQYNVRVVCTTDDPTDDLQAHARHAQSIDRFTQLLPTWRPDRALAVDDPKIWNGWVDRLAAAAGVDVGSYASLLDALERRHSFFHDQGCRLSDHGLDQLWVEPSTAAQREDIVGRLRRGQNVSPHEATQFRSALLHDLALLDHRRGWVQQFHLGAMRNNNSRMMGVLGPDTGFDSIGDLPQAVPLARFLDGLDRNDQLAKTILYNLNPADNEVFATVLGNFQGGVPGKMQFGSAWWFLDQLDGMRRQVDALSNMGLLSRFVGMLTDSRSFLSYSRHEYFRRMLCQILGDEADRGLIPSDFDLLAGLVRAVCYGNARTYFGFANLPAAD